jgi:hypothetical protein
MQLTTFCWKQLRITLLRVCAMHFIRIYLSGTQQYNTHILFPIKEPFPAEQLTKNLIQWLWIDYIDWKMTTFYETRHHLTCVVLSHKYILPSYGTAGSMIPRYLFCLFLCTAFVSGFSIYIFINTTVTFIESSGHSVQMSWIFVSTRIFIFSLKLADIFILPWYHTL